MRLQVCAYGCVRARMFDASSPAKGETVVGLSQANPRARESLARFGRYVQSGERLVQRGAELLLWSESATLQGLSPAALESLVGLRIRDRVHVPVLVGAVVTDADGSFRNAALLMDGEGRVRDRHDKIKLFPCGETGAFGAGRPLPSWNPSHSVRLEAGVRDEPLTLAIHNGEHKAHVSLCYEDVVPSGTLLGPGKSDAGMEVVFANDSWSDGTSGIDLHLAHARFRAVERGRKLVRSATTGVSAVISPLGDIAFQLPRNAEAEGTATVSWLDSGTLYESWGAFPALLLGVLSILISRGVRQT